MSYLNILSQFLSQIFNMFSQMVQYVIEAPGNSFNTIMENWGQSFSSYGIIIPVVFVIIVGITGAIIYTFIEMNKSIDDAMNAPESIGGM